MLTKTPFLNPYTNRAAIRNAEAFFGREKELRDIYTRIRGGGSVSLVGERRVGKSSLLNAVEFERESFGVPQALTFVRIDMQSIPDCTQSFFIKQLLKRISEATGLAVGEPDRSSLDRVAQEAREQGFALTIMLDEFDVMIHNENIPTAFYSFLRSWSATFQIPFVVASREGSIEQVTEDEKTGSAFLNIFTPIYVGPLEEADAEELIYGPSQMMGLEFTKEEGEFVLELSGYFPLFLQIACYHLFDLKQSGVNSDDLLGRVETYFAFEATPHFEYLYRRLSGAERRALGEWVSAGDVSDKSAQAQLLRKGILVNEDPKPRIFSRTFETLVRTKEVSGHGLIQSVKSAILG